MDFERIDPPLKSLERQPKNLRLLDDLDLALLLGTADEAVEGEVWRRYDSTIADFVRRELVPRLEGRGRRLRDERSELRGIAMTEVFDWLVGHRPGQTRWGGKPFVKTRNPRLLAWAASSSLPLFAFIRGCFQDDDALRAWNRARGLPVRVHFTTNFSSSAVDGLLDQVRGLTPEFDMDLDLVAREIEGLSGLRLFDALWRDACQPAGELIDIDRISRRLGVTQEAVVLAAFGRVVTAFDSLLHIRFSDAYDRYLDRARQQTRQHGSW